MSVYYQTSIIHKFKKCNPLFMGPSIRFSFAFNPESFSFVYLVQYMHELELVSEACVGTLSRQAGGCFSTIKYFF